MNKILIIDDDVASCRTLQLHFSSQGYEVSLAHSADEGYEQIKKYLPDVIILDIHMPGKSGLEGLKEYKQDFPDIPVIMITAFHDMDSTIEAMKSCATDYIHKPVDINELEDSINRAISNNSSSDNVILLEAPQNQGNSTMISRSPLMKDVFITIGRVAPKPVYVLLTGESGTGKELVARAIHNASANPDAPFVAVNCAALVETLLESDLFGHEKGAFTGAVNKHKGKFEIANNGTIFLDEIGEMSPAIQAKLLRVLQEKEYTPVGSSQTKITNARVIAATNVNLEQRVKNHTFREDLYYRLQVVSIKLPSLRARKEDIEPLIQVLFSRINKEVRHNVSRLSVDVLQALIAYDWPGNVRELENVITKAVALCPGDIITADLIPPHIMNSQQVAIKTPTKPSYQMSLEEVEKAHVEFVLQATNWHKGKACQILGTSRPRLRRMIQQYKLNNPSEEVA
jgi:DNA-binding NtrC family response regulator